jgi:hypothetical protein
LIRPTKYEESRRFVIGRPKKPQPALPLGLREGQPVKVTGIEFKGAKLALIVGWCKHNDGGIYVWLTGDSTPGHSVYACIQTERGDTIEGIEL